MWILAALAAEPLLPYCDTLLRAGAADRGWACLGYAAGLGREDPAGETSEAAARRLKGDDPGVRTGRGVAAVLALAAPEVTPARLDRISDELCRDAERCPAGHTLDLLLDAAVRDLEAGLAPGEVRQRLREGAGRVARVAGRPGAELPETRDLSRWEGGLEEPLRLQLGGARSAWLDDQLRSSGDTAAASAVRANPGCAPELGSSCPRSPVPPGVDMYDMEAFARLYGRSSPSSTTGRPAGAVTLLDVSPRSFPSAWRDVQTRQEPAELLGFLARWLEVAPAADLATPASREALRLLPPLVELFHDTAAFDRGGPGVLAARLEPGWYRALAVLHAAGELEAAFRLQAALVGRRHRWGRALRVARERPTPALQTALQTWERVERLSAPVTKVVAQARVGADSLAPGLLSGPEAARRAVLAAVPPLAVPTLAAAQEALRHQPEPSVILILDGTERDPWTSLLTSERWVRHPIPTSPGEPPLAALVDSTLARLRDPAQGAALAEDLHALYRRAIAPVAAALPAGGTVYVVATGALSRAPLEALLEAPPPVDREGPDWRHARFLGARLRWLHLPSVAWLTTPAPTARGTVTVVVGKSQFSARVGSPPTAAPTPGANLPSLPGVLDELDMARARLAARAPLVWCDEGCTEPPTVAAVRGVVGRAALLHVATHALAGDHPWLRQVGRSDGALVLTGSDGAPALWTATDVERLQASAELVVLSACDTRITGADPLFGELGLANAFLVAGARVVVATRWAIPDDGPRRFFSAFYERYLAGESAAAALQGAQAQLRTRGDPHPGAWAAFTASGVAPVAR